MQKKYEEEKYTKVEEGIHKIFDDWNYEDLYVTSLLFEQEPELEEGEDASYISQYPIEDILDKYYVYISDFYEDLNKQTLKHAIKNSQVKARRYKKLTRNNK